MRLRKDQIPKLSQFLLKSLKEEKLVHVKVDDAKLLSKVEQVILDNLLDEEKIDAEAKGLIDQYRSQISQGSLNEQELFQKIKRELAKKKKFVL